MANSASSQSPLPTTSALTPRSIIDDIFELTAANDVEVMLNRALRLLNRLLGAEAGSILFYGQQTYNIRMGPFRSEALARVEQWETTIAQRLQEGSWRISETTAKISISKLSASQLTLASTPVTQNGQVVGLMSFVLPPKHSLNAGQQGLLAKFAAGLSHLTILLDELALANQRVKRIGDFYDIGQALLTTFDIGKLLADTMELAANLIDAGAASIMLIDKEQDELVFKVSHGARSELLRQQRIPMDEGIAGWVARTGRPVVANDARADARFSHRVDVRTGFLTQSIAAVPLKVQGRVTGILEVLNKYSDSGFNQDDIQLMSFIASQAAIALENAKLYNQLRSERDTLINAQDNLLRTIKTNLQDKQLQLLSAVSLSLDHLNVLSKEASPDVMQNQIGALKTMTEQAIGNTRRLLFDLHPSILETQGLLTALEHYVDQLQQASSVDLHFDAAAKTRYPPKVSRIVFSIIQELVDNAIRHAEANNLWLTLRDEDDRLVAVIKDDGQGFDPEEVGAGKQNHTPLGLTLAKAQAAAIDATLEIESQTQPPQRGTSVRLVLPPRRGNNE